MNTSDYTVPCHRCGIPVPAQDPGNDNIIRILNNYLYCPPCKQIKDAELEEDRQKFLQHEKDKNFTMRMESSGIPWKYIEDRKTGRNLTSPLIRQPAEFIWKNRTTNLLLSGVTGTGKSTSACFAAMTMMQNSDAKVSYTTLQDIIEDYVSTKRLATTSVKRFMQDLAQNSVLIIDEFIGNCTISKTAQEFVFNLLENVNSGKIWTKLWILGNFYSGSIQQYFENPDPIIRRLNTNFVIGIINPKTSAVEMTKISTENP